MKTSFKKFAAAALSTAMIVAPSFSALAANPTQEAGNGNILAYSVTSVVVPTDINVALNPQGLEITRGEDDVVTDQIVTFNYGIGNLSTDDMVADLTLTVKSEDSGITFVDSEEAVEAAEAGELKMYLELVDGTGVKTSEDAAFAVEEKTGANAHNLTAANLCNVNMTLAEDGEVVFAGEGDVVAEKSFSLTKATYAVQDGQTVDFDTTQEELAGKMEISALGGVKGFTISGAMNEDADWTKADVTVIEFEPLYEIQTALAAAEAAAAAQGPRLATASFTKSADNAAIELTVNNLGEDSITGVENEQHELIGSELYIISSNKVTLTSDLMGYITEDRTFYVCLESGEKLSVSISIGD